MPRYLNPFTDYGFKKLFGEEAHIDFLIDFLNALNIHFCKITEISFRKSEKLGNAIIDRRAFFDLYCIDEKGNRFIVELQRADQEFFKDRALYYSSFAIQEQAEVGNWNYKLSAVYFVGILDFELKGEKLKTDKYIHKVVLMEEDDKTVFYDKLKYVYIEIPKFNKKEDELITTLDKWLYFMKYLSKLESIPNALNTEMFIKAFDIAEMINMGKESRIEYEESLKVYRDLKVVLDESFDKGILKGKIEAIKNNAIKLLTKKLGDIPKALEEKIISCDDIEKLDSVLNNIFDFTSFDEIENILVK